MPVTKFQTIVIAWAEKKSAPGSVLEGRSCIWLNTGRQKDVKEAVEFAKRNEYFVLTYPITEKDPLEKARKDVLEFYLSKKDK